MANDAEADYAMMREVMFADAPTRGTPHAAVAHANTRSSRIRDDLMFETRICKYRKPQHRLCRPRHFSALPRAARLLSVCRQRPAHAPFDTLRSPEAPVRADVDVCLMSRYRRPYSTRTPRSLRSCPAFH